MNNETEQTSVEPKPRRYQCRHILPEGRRCEGPCLRGEQFCYFHHSSRPPVTTRALRTRRARSSSFELPLPEDRGAIQISLGQVMQRIASNDIDLRRAGLLVYILQTAAANLPRLPRTKE